LNTIRGILLINQYNINQINNTLPRTPERQNVPTDEQQQQQKMGQIYLQRRRNKENYKTFPRQTNKNAISHTKHNTEHIKIPFTRDKCNRNGGLRGDYKE
jgi:hypothetical protein